MNWDIPPHKADNYRFDPEVRLFCEKHRAVPGHRQLAIGHLAPPWSAAPQNHSFRMFFIAPLGCCNATLTGIIAKLSPSSKEILVTSWTKTLQTARLLLLFCKQSAVGALH
jgi:hypothetical protein